MDLIFQRVDKKAMNLQRKEKEEIKAWIKQSFKMRSINDLEKIYLNGRDRAIYYEGLSGNLNPAKLFEEYGIIQETTNYFCGMFKTKNPRNEFVFIVDIGELLHLKEKEYRIYPAKGRRKLYVKLLN
jgi:hypothetical protein